MGRGDQAVNQELTPPHSDIPPPPPPPPPPPHLPPSLPAGQGQDTAVSSKNHQGKAGKGKLLEQSLNYICLLYAMSDSFFTHLIMILHHFQCMLASVMKNVGTMLLYSVTLCLDLTASLSDLLYVNFVLFHAQCQFVYISIKCVCLAIHQVKPS